MELFRFKFDGRIGDPAEALVRADHLNEALDMMAAAKGPGKWEWETREETGGFWLVNTEDSILLGMSPRLPFTVDKVPEEKGVLLIAWECEF